MNTKRPAIISLVSIWFLISGILLVQLALSGFAQSTAEWYPAYLYASAAAYFASGVGLWMMRKWGFYVFFLISVVNQVVLIVVNKWNVASLVIAVVLVVVCFLQYSKMK